MAALRDSRLQRWPGLLPVTAMVVVLTLALADSSSRAAGDDLAGCKDLMCFEFGSLVAETNHAHAHDFNVVYTVQGLTRLHADEAEGAGLDQRDSHWVLKGNVRADAPTTTLRADAATVELKHERILSMTATGDPAQFTFQGVPSLRGNESAVGDSGTISMRGHARSITVDLEHQTVHLIGDAWASNGCSDMASAQINYDLNSGRIEAGAAINDAPAGVQGTIRSVERSGCGSAARATGNP